MNIEGLENLTLKELKDIFKVNNLSIKKAMPIMRDFRDKHELNDKQALNAFGVAKRLFEAV